MGANAIGFGVSEVGVFNWGWAYSDGAEERY